MSNEDQSFAICKHRETGEYHIFPTKMMHGNKCFFSGTTSICKEMTVYNRSCCIASCESRGEILEKAEELGESMCGTCLKLILEQGSE